MISPTHLEELKESAEPLEPYGRELRWGHWTKQSQSPCESLIFTVRLDLFHTP